MQSFIITNITKLNMKSITERYRENSKFETKQYTSKLPVGQIEK